MARDVSGLATEIEALIQDALSKVDPADRDATIAAYALALATAIDNYIGKIKTSIDTESLV